MSAVGGASPQQSSAQLQVTTYQRGQSKYYEAVQLEAADAGRDKCKRIRFPVIHQIHRGTLQKVFIR